MTPISEQLLHQLRNKLQPIKTFFDLQRLLESNKAQPNRGFTDGWNEAKLDQKINEVKLQCEPALAQIIFIIEQLENEHTNK